MYHTASEKKSLHLRAAAGMYRSKIASPQKPFSYEAGQPAAENTE